MPKNKNLSGGLFAAKPTPLTIKETPLSAQIAEWLDARSIYNDRLQCGQIETKRGNWLRLCKVGTPDRFAIVRGQIIFIEVKMLGKKPTFNQMRQCETLRDSGAIVLVADSFISFIFQFNEIRAQIEQRGNIKELDLYD